MRIIAGSARGRTFEAPSGRSTRPTLDRVREAVFGMIQFDVPGSRVLDLFAGSGGLGLEALSRGAEKAVFCDCDKSVCALISRNAERLGFSDRSMIICDDYRSAIRRLASKGERFSIVLLDPPYESGYYSAAVNELHDAGLLADGCIIIAEHSAKSPLELSLDGLTAGKPHRYGDVAVSKYEFRQNILPNKE